jgi:hypothetical protein
MFETLYRTAEPEKLDKAEYYQPQIEIQLADEKTVYFVKERHGWWDPKLERAVHHTVTLNPEEGYSTSDEATARYNEQLQHRASQGFIHSFSIDPSSDPPFKYRKLTVAERLQ